MANIQRTENAGKNFWGETFSSDWCIDQPQDEQMLDQILLDPRPSWESEKKSKALSLDAIPKTSHGFTWIFTDESQGAISFGIGLLVAIASCIHMINTHC